MPADRAVAAGSVGERAAEHSSAHLRRLGGSTAGLFEADLVGHSGPSLRGSFVHSLVLTDIATGWTECAPLLVRKQAPLTTVMTELRTALPFPLQVFDTDNDGVFMNETVRDYCRVAGVVFTRCRPHRKNDQTRVERKNGAVVRRLVGYRRYEGVDAAAALAGAVCDRAAVVNFFQPSFKLAEKHREGARVRKRYHAPACAIPEAAIRGTMQRRSWAGVNP